MTWTKWNWNVLNSLATTDCVALGCIFGPECKSDVQTRVSRRAMTMGFVYFLVFIAASGAIIFFYGHRSVMARNKRKTLHSGQQSIRKVDDSLLALRRNAIGRTSPDPDRTEFLERVDVWQKDHQLRRDWFNQNTESIHGTKYTYTPPPKRGSAEANSS